MTITEHGDRLRRIPWARAASLAVQTVQEHVVDDPVQLMLQAARRLPDSVSRPLGSALTVVGSRGAGVLSAVGHEMRGERSAAERALQDGSRRRPSPRAIVRRADAWLGLGQDHQAEAELDSVPVAERDAAWRAVAARIAVHRGEMDQAVALADADRRNRHVGQRLRGERDAFLGHRPALGPVTAAQPVPGRILHVLNNSLPHTASGYANRSHAILRATAAHGFTVEAVTRPGYPVQVGIPHGAWTDTIDGIRYNRLLPYRLAQGLAARQDQYAQLLSQEVTRFRPALIHATTHFINGQVVREVARAHGIPWIYEVRGQLADTWASTRGPQALDSERYRRFVEREAEIARSADGVVTLGEQMRDRLVDQGVDPDRITVCPNAVGDRFLEEPPTRAHARTRLGLDQRWGEDAQIVGTVSSIVDYEGLDSLVRAVALLAPRHSQLRLRIAGDGVARPRLEVLAQELGIADISDFPGRVDRAEAILHHAALDLFVVPRRDLPVTRTVTPMKSVEASAVGRAVIASDLPALAELVVPGQTGLLVIPEDDQALAEAIGGLLKDPDQARRLGAEGRRWAVETRSWVSNAERYARLYESLGAGVDIVGDAATP